MFRHFARREEGKSGEGAAKKKGGIRKANATRRGGGEDGGVRFE